VDSRTDGGRQCVKKRSRVKMYKTVLCSTKDLLDAKVKKSPSKLYGDSLYISIRNKQKMFLTTCQPGGFSVRKCLSLDGF